MGILKRQPRKNPGILDYWFNGAQLHGATARLAYNERILNALNERRAAGNTNPLTEDEKRALFHPATQPEQ
jgi:hypothetical protein